MEIPANKHDVPEIEAVEPALVHVRPSQPTHGKTPLGAAQRRNMPFTTSGLLGRSWSDWCRPR